MTEEKKHPLPEEENPGEKEKIAFDRVLRWINLEDQRILLQEFLEEVLREQKDLERDPAVAATRGAIKAAKKKPGPPKKIGEGATKEKKETLRERLKRKLQGTPSEVDAAAIRKKNLQNP